MATTTPTTIAPAHSGIFILCVRVRNFRCLRLIEVGLTPMTVLIGQNNAGKTSFLEAVVAVLGTGPRHLTEDDIFIADTESKLPQDREMSIDLLIRPTDPSGTIIQSFPAGSPWLQLWGNGIVQDDNDNDIVGIRMLMAWDRIKGEYVTKKHFLREWNNVLADAQPSELAQQAQVTSAQLLPLSLYLLDAKRDAAEEMRARGSVWTKLISDHGLTDEDIQAIEEQLNDINELLVTKSPVLSHIQEHLSPVGGIVNCNAEDVSVNPVARRLRDLRKGMDVVLATRGAQQFPLSHQGMGTRSLASILLFSAYMRWQQQNQSSDALHPFVAIEEPEAHLHPQAQRALFEHLAQFPGQRIVSTHSPYVCSQADIESFVHFFKEGNDTIVSRFYKAGDARLDGESLRAINRRVMNTRGDLLFSRCVVLFEGETEEQALPDFAERYWRRHPNELGVSFVSVDGSGNYLPFLRLAIQFRIPWVVFSDGEPSAIAALDNALTTMGQVASATNPSCVVLPNAQNFEQYVTNADALDALRQMCADFSIERGGVTDVRGIAGIRSSWSTKTAAEIIEELTIKKTAYGARIAAAYGRLSDDKQTPACLKRAFDLVLPPAVPSEEAPA